MPDPTAVTDRPWLANLNDEQRAAATHDAGPLLIVAGAGTGKTTTLAARVADLIERGVAPDRILLLTFTRRAAQEMIRRVASMTDRRAASQVWGGTFHAIANRLLRQYGAAAGLPPGVTVLDQGDAADLMGVIRSEQHATSTAKRFPKKETIAGIYSRMVNSQAKLSEVLEHDYPWCADHRDAIRSILAAYNDRKRAHAVLDYDDLLLFWRGLAASPEIGPQLQGLFDHVLVDEYQDTNPIQADIVAGLCAGSTEITAVGDDAQAIYGFRSATVANMWAFADQFPGTTRITLEQNYRSTTPILAVANAVLTQSDAHFDKALWSRRPGSRRPVLTTCADEAAQSRLVADSVLALREEGTDLRDQAVLFRAGHHSDALELELMRRDIPFVKYGGLKYLEAAHVKDLLALLRILDNPRDELAWHRVLGMLDGVGPATTRRLLDDIGQGTDPDRCLQRFLDDDLRVPASSEIELAALRTALDTAVGSSSAEPSPAEQLDGLIGFCEPVFARRYDNAAARVGDIEQLRAMAGEYANRSRFLTELTLDPPDRTGDLAQAPHLDDDWLVLSTIHSAKGGEWKAVHLLHAADGNIPSDMALSDRDGLDEELRLLYVALTRARDVLSITFPLRYHVNRYGTDDRHLYAQLSRFLDPVRPLCDEEGVGHDPEPTVDRLDLTAVGLTDEVDTLVHSLLD